MGFSRQEYWSELPCLPSEDLSDPGVEPASLVSPALAGRFFTTSTTRFLWVMENWAWPHQPSQPALGLSDATKTPTLLLWEQAWVPHLCSLCLFCLEFPISLSFPILLPYLICVCFFFFLIMGHKENRVYFHHDFIPKVNILHLA